MRRICCGLAPFLLLLLALFPVPGRCADGEAAGHGQAAGQGPSPGSMPLDKEGDLRISEEDRCPVCAMRPIKHPKFATAICLTDGSVYYFCGTGCMIRSWMHPQHYLGVLKGRLDRPVVREYFTGQAVDARNVKWVAGSDVVGPMGPAPVPVSGAKALEAFQRRHGGKVIFTLDEIDEEKWREITGNSTVPE